MLRLVLAVAAAAVTCAIAGLILGEYEFSGATPIGAGLLAGLVVSELVIEIAHTRSRVLAFACAGMLAAGLARAAYESSGEGLRPFPTGGWIAIALGAATVLVRVGGWRRPVDDAADDVTTPG